MNATSSCGPSPLMLPCAYRLLDKPLYQTVDFGRVRGLTMIVHFYPSGAPLNVFVFFLGPRLVLACLDTRVCSIMNHI